MKAPRSSSGSTAEARLGRARSFDELIRLLPHGLGFIYDVLASLSRGRSVEGHVSNIDVARWTAAGFEPENDPSTTMKLAFESSPSFEAWLGTA